MAGEWTEERDRALVAALDRADSAPTGGQADGAVVLPTGTVRDLRAEVERLRSDEEFRAVRAERDAAVVAAREERARAEKAEAEVARLLGNAMPPEWEQHEQRDAIRKLDQALRSVEAERDALKDEVERLRAAPTTIPLGELKQVTYVTRMATPSELTDEVERLRERVAALEAVLAPPTREELIRLAGVAMDAVELGIAGWMDNAVCAVLVELRKRAGVTP